MGKTSQQQQQIKLPPEIKTAALKNLDLAQQVGSLPYAPNFGLTTAAFTPEQQAAFGNTAAAASAFGLPGGTSGGGSGLPPPTNVGGFSGYSTQPMYQHAMAQVPPAVLAMYNAFFGPHTAKPPAANPMPSFVRPSASQQQWPPGMMGPAGSGTYDWSLNGGQGGFRTWGS